MTKTEKPVRTSTSVFSIVLMRPPRPITSVNELECLIGAKRKGRNMSRWVLPGGGANRGVPLQEEFLRETKQETRLEIKPIWPEVFMNEELRDGEHKKVNLFGIFTQADPAFRLGSVNFTDELRSLTYRSLGHICGQLRRSWSLPETYQQAIDHFMANGVFETLFRLEAWEEQPLDIPDLPRYAYKPYNRPKSMDDQAPGLSGAANTACA